MYRDISRDLLEAIEPVVEAHGLELVDIAQGSSGRGRLVVTVDTPSGDGRVTVGECAAVSRELSHLLDVEDVVPGSYVLEVTSPGVDRVLGREKDFARVVGRKVSVETREPLDGRRHFRGELLAFGGEGAQVQTESGPIRIPFKAISRAQAFFPFEEIPAPQRRSQKR
jgi:ribosome maturation factor RimP